MARKDLNLPSLQEMIMLAKRPAPTNQVDFVEATEQGLALEDTLMKRKQDQASREQALADKIKQLKAQQGFASQLKEPSEKAAFQVDPAEGLKNWYKMKQMEKMGGIKKDLVASKPKETPQMDPASKRELVKLQSNAAKLRPEVKTINKELDRLSKITEKGTRGGLMGAAKMKYQTLTNQIDEQTKNTLEVTNTLKNVAARMLKSTFPGAISEGERQFLVGITGGKAINTPEERKIAMDNIRRIIEAKSNDAEGALQEFQSMTTGQPISQSDQLTPEEEAELQALEQEMGGM